MVVCARLLRKVIVEKRADRVSVPSGCAREPFIHKVLLPDRGFSRIWGQAGGTGEVAHPMPASMPLTRNHGFRAALAKCNPA